MDEGDTVTFRVFNNDTVFPTNHTFDLNGHTAHLDLAPGEEGNVTFTAGSAGTYWVFCDIPGHATDTDGDGVKDDLMAFKFIVSGPDEDPDPATPGPELLLIALVIVGLVAAVRYGRRSD